MKTWEYETIRDASTGTIAGQLCDWPEVAEALTANGVPLHPGVRMKAVKEICRLVLAESKIGNVRKNSEAVKELQEILLLRGTYVSNNDIAETYGDYCESFASTSWVSDLSYWLGCSFVTPIDYIAARIGK